MTEDIQHSLKGYTLLDHIHHMLALLSKHGNIPRIYITPEYGNVYLLTADQFEVTDTVYNTGPEHCDVINITAVNYE